MYEQALTKICQLSRCESPNRTIIAWYLFVDCVKHVIQGRYGEPMDPGSIIKHAHLRFLHTICQDIDIVIYLGSRFGRMPLIILIDQFNDQGNRMGVRSCQTSSKSNSSSSSSRSSGIAAAFELGELSSCLS
jgi:hypothetical protein